MLTRTLALFGLGLVALLFASTDVPAFTPVADNSEPEVVQKKNDQDKPGKKFQPEKKFDPKGQFGKGFGKDFGKGGFGKGGMGQFGKGPFGKGDFKKGDFKKGDFKKDEPKEKLSPAEIKEKYEYYKKLYEESQRASAASNLENRIDRLIRELEDLRKEVRSKK